MKYLLPLLIALNMAPKEPERLTFEVHPNYIVEEMKHIDDDNDEADNNEAVEIINNILK